SLQHVRPRIFWDFDRVDFLRKHLHESPWRDLWEPIEAGCKSAEEGAANLNLLPPLILAWKMKDDRNALDIAVSLLEKAIEDPHWPGDTDGKDFFMSGL